MTKQHGLPLAPADIVFTRDKGLSSWWLRTRQGDFDYSHVCLVGQPRQGRPTLYTTGGKAWVYLGLVDAETYLADKAFAVRRYTQPGHLTARQVGAIIAAIESRVGTIYPIWKIFKFWLLHWRGRRIKKLGKRPNYSPKTVFCSESVAYAYWAAGIQLNPAAGKEDPTAYTPETLWFDPHMETIYQKF